MGVQFCEQCGSKLTKQTYSGDVVFVCICKQSYPSLPKDTLMAEEYMESGDSKLKYNVFIENSAHDPTNKIIKRQCSECEKNFMKVIRIGSTEQIIYVCTCGAIEYK